MPAHDEPGAEARPTSREYDDPRTPAPAPRPSRRGPLSGSAALAAVLSFVFPGLGQALAGAARRALAFALPAILLLVVLAGIWIVDRGVFVRGALNPPILLAVVGASLVVLVYRLWAIGDAYRLNLRQRAAMRTPPWGRAASLLVLVAVVGVTVFMHGWVAYVGWSGHQALVALSDPDGPGFLGGSDAASPTPTADPTPLVSASDGPEPTPTTEPTPVPTPSPTPQPAWAADGRLNVLLIGSDAGPGRWSMRADAIILVSADVASGRVAAFSLPRYTRNVPLPEPAAAAFACGCLSEDYINALYVYANQHPDLFPGDSEVDRGLTALSGAIATLFGTTLDGMAVADLNGFVRLVDAIGGVTIDVPYEIYDAEYPPPDGSGLVEVYFAPGLQHMDGWHALAFARTRHQDGDVARMQRQQIVIGALKQELSCNLLGNLPGILDVARESLWTNVPLDQVPEMMQIDPGPLESHVLFDTHNVTLTADDVARIRGEFANAFDGPAPPPDPETEC